MLDTGFADADDSTGLLLWRITNAWQAAQRAALKPYDLTHVQFVLLAGLTWLAGDEPVTQKAVAAHTGTDPMMASQVLRALEAKSLIERGRHPTDSRANALTPTPAGRDLANRAVRAVEDVDRRFFGPLGADQAAFTAALRRLDKSHPRG
ncbi:MarR family winged helix-turn-helix transcriptional regulator [Virgisporangium aurantiacum]|uniref:MarR family transcriptional regulator n=1 Tax=Virgisporangium aurantiacum TaxID=175570 RepID=A0A8J3Z2W3_9ACTN|nr:MarR family winged helix-turn-helix transcriptional regulator [Virgisporangium aurantiacum]GIJ56461.1 MarR family transcriptional regulator [Virgisporangium aurantiacum]